MFTDFVINRGGSYEGGGQLGSVLEGVRFDAGLMRPYYDSRGRKCVTINTGQTKWDDKRKQFVPVFEKVLIRDLIRNDVDSPVFNATSLRKEEWIMLDDVIIKAARQRLRAWADLSAANTFGGFDGMSKMILEHETMSDPGEAMVDMEGLTEGRTDAPLNQLEGLPLPITHSDFWFSRRRLAVSRNSRTPLSTTMGEAAGRRVAEMIEKTLIGVETGVTYGGNSTQVGGYGRASSVYGYTNFPNRLTKSDLTVPTGANPEATVADVLAMRDQLYANKFYGPFMVYHSNNWDKYMDNDYARLGGNNASMTLRDRLEKIDGISGVRRLDFLPAGTGGVGTYVLLMVQMTPDVARAVNGMNITVLQWESQGGMRLNFKVMCIMVPQLRADYYGNCGILHAKTAT